MNYIIMYIYLYNSYRAPTEGIYIYTDNKTRIIIDYNYIYQFNFFFL